MGLGICYIIFYYIHGYPVKVRLEIGRYYNNCIIFYSVGIGMHFYNNVHGSFN